MNSHWCPFDPQFDPQYWKCNLCEERFPDHRYGYKFMTGKSIDEFKKWAEENPKLLPKLNWVISEPIGEAVFNPKAIKRIK